MAASKIQQLWNHPAGLKTIHFWAPTFKWGITVANIVDSTRPPEKVSYPQQAALASSGLIWARYSFIVTPRNWNLMGVSIATFATCSYQLARKIQHDYSSANEATPT